MGFSGIFFFPFHVFSHIAGKVQAINSCLTITGESVSFNVILLFS